MFNLGFSEMAFIAILALVLIGPKQLPEVARTLGRFLNDLKRSTNSLKDELKYQVKLDQDEIRRKIMEPNQPKKNIEHQKHVGIATESESPKTTESSQSGESGGSSGDT